MRLFRAFDWSGFRRRLIGETESFLDDALKNPHNYPSIPAKPCTDARPWPPTLAEDFWTSTLDLQPAPPPAERN